MTVVLNKRRGGMHIVGSGGGGKGGGGSARTPVEHPDSLHNMSYAAVLDLIGNGELAGPVHPDAPLRDIYLNGTPIQNEDGSLNFQHVQAEYRVGTVDQSHIAGFPASSSVTSVGAEVKATQPFSQLLTNPDLSAVRVSIYAPQLIQMIETGDEAGDRVGVVVEYSIDLAIGSGSFKEVLRSSLDGKTVNGYTRTHRIELPKTNSGWTFRVRRITPDSTNSAVTDKIFVQSYAEVIDGKFRYPMSALMGIRIDAEQFQSIPTRAYHWRGKIIRVPSNYNPETRAYFGVWDGTFKRAWSDNPAWIYYDVLTSRLSGLGDRIEAHMIDRYALYQIGAYCDQLVSDGQGGKEPRFRVGLLYIQSQEDALRVLNDLASVFRGMSYWANGQVVAVADMPDDPVYTYTNANVIDGVFEYTGSDLSTRKTVALVSWNDPTDFYRSKVEAVEDDAGIRRYGIRKSEVVAFGCTSRGQAQRVGLYHLYTSRMETGGVGFSVGLDGVIPQPGSIVKIADRNRAGRHIGGRIREATATVITLDREHPVKAGDTLTVNLPNGKPETRTVSLVTGRIVRVRSAFSVAPAPESVWTVEASDLVMQYVRVISVRERDAVTYEISGVLHHPGKYAAIDDGVRLDPLPISVIPARTQEAPKNIRLSSYYVIKEGVSKHTLVIAWDKAKGASRYEAQFRRNNSNWVSLQQTGSTSIEVDNIYSGLYEARVRAINALDVPSLWAYGTATELDGLVGEPPRVTSLTTEGVPWGINLRWAFPSVPNIIERSEIRYGPSSDFNDATVLGEYAYPTNNFAHQGLKIDAEFFYWARLIDKNGVAGAWYPYENQPGIRGTPSQVAEEYNDLITKEILQSALGKQLFEDIESIEDLWQQFAELGIDFDRLGIEFEEVNGKFVLVNNQLASMNNRFAGLDSEISSIEAQIADLAGTGEWDNAQSYTLGQIVKFDGALYRAKQDVPVGTPVSNATYWEKIGDYSSVGEAITALVSRMAAAETSIDELTGVVTAHASDITQLQSSVTNLEEDVEGTATAVSQLETNVSDINGKMVVASKQATVLAATVRRLDESEGDLDTAMAAFENRAFIKETQEVVATNKKAVARSLLEIGARIDDNVALISEVKESVVTSETAQAQVNQSLAAQVQDNASTISNVQTVIADLESSQATVNNEIMSQVGTNAAKITGLEQTVADDKSAQSLINQSLQSQIEDTENKVTANAGAISSLQTSVTIHGDRLTSQGQSITQLQSRAQSLEGDVSGLSGALSGLQSTVSAQGNSITSQGTSITQLQGKLNTTDGKISGLTDALSSLETTVTTQGDTLTSQGSSITALQNRAGTIESDLSGVSGALNTLQSTVTAQGNSITSQGSSITQLQSRVTDTESGISGVSSSLSSLNTKVTGIDGRVTAQATSITQLDTKVGSATTSIQDLSRSVNSIDGRLEATRTIKVAVNSGGTQYLAGIGLSVDNSTSGMQSQVVVVAGRFSVMHNTTGSPQAVFSVQNGTSIINTALIGKAVITSAHIADAAIDTAHIKNAAIKSALIGNAEIGTLKIGGNAVTTLASNAAGDRLDYAGVEQPVLSVTFNGSASPCVVNVSLDNFGLLNRVYIYRNGGLIAQRIGGNNRGAFSMSVHTATVSGSNTFTVAIAGQKFSNAEGADKNYLTGRSIGVFEAKR